MISALTQVGRCGLLFRFACSAVLWGGRGTADQYHWPVWGALAVFRPHGLCPRSRVCAFPVYTAVALGCSIGSGPCVACGSSFWVLHKDADLVGPAFCVFPGRSSSGRQELTGALSPGGVHLIPSAAPASVSVQAGLVRPVSVLRSCPLATTLSTDVNHPESQEVFG